jgi:hypothetical protein
LRIALPQFQVCLLLDTLERANWNVPLRMRNGDASKLRWVLELNMTAFSVYFVPAVSLQGGNDISAVQDVYLYTLNGLVNVTSLSFR